MDGAHVGEDFNGGLATETAVRVEAWPASANSSKSADPRFVFGANSAAWRASRQVRPTIS
jgi:hypothetical protein